MSPWDAVKLDDVGMQPGEIKYTCIRFGRTGNYKIINSRTRRRTRDEETRAFEHEQVA